MVVKNYGWQGVAPSRMGGVGWVAAVPVVVQATCLTALVPCNKTLSRASPKIPYKLLGCRSWLDYSFILNYTYLVLMWPHSKLRPSTTFQPKQCQERYFGIGLMGWWVYNGLQSPITAYHPHHCTDHPSSLPIIPDYFTPSPILQNPPALPIIPYITAHHPYH